MVGEAAPGSKSRRPPFQLASVPGTRRYRRLGIPRSVVSRTNDPRVSPNVAGLRSDRSGRSFHKRRQPFQDVRAYAVMDEVPRAVFDSRTGPGAGPRLVLARGRPDLCGHRAERSGQVDPFSDPHRIDDPNGRNGRGARHGSPCGLPPHQTVCRVHAGGRSHPLPPTHVPGEPNVSRSPTGSRWRETEEANRRSTRYRRPLGCAATRPDLACHRA